MPRLKPTYSYILVLIAILILGPAPADAQEVHNFHCAFGCPTGTPASNDLIVRYSYTLSSNDQTKFADWVAYVVTRDTIGPSQSRTWKADPFLDDSETLEPEDYKDAYMMLETDRGHQVPLASFSSTQYWEETNFLSNITPQKSDLNRGPWQRLEAAVRRLALEADVNAVYVITGPLYERSMPPLPRADEAHQIPSGYWKVVTTVSDSEVRTAAFVFDQGTPRLADHCEFQVPLEEVEGRSGLDVFPRLSEQEQGALHGMACVD